VVVLVMVKECPLLKVRDIRFFVVFSELTRVADRLVQAKARLEADEEATEEELLDLQRQMNERLSKLMRLRRQKRLLQSKGLRMLEQDVLAEGELESSAQPSTGESSSVVDSIAAGAVDLIDWDSILADVPFDGSSGPFDGMSSEVVGH
jgi:hypothetical protein